MIGTIVSGGEDEVACALAGQADGAAPGEMKEREASVNRQATMNKGRDKIKMKMETETGISQQRYLRDGCRMEQGRQGKAKRSTCGVHINQQEKRQPRQFIVDCLEDCTTRNRSWAIPNSQSIHQQKRETHFPAATTEILT
ncbi:hypothetical protein FALCPG4_001699 [Fusarium falciforme]